MSTTEAQSEAQLPELQQKFLALESALNQELVERETEIRSSLTALVAGQHVFLLGPPGVAKSLFVKRLETRIQDVRSYEILLTRFSTPEEVMGPQSLAALKEDRFERKTDGYLPTADISFIDEIFKANSSILNALLQMINERTYRHGTEMIDIPLSTLFCASNELPQDESLSALYDRLLIRLEVKEIQDNDAFIRMLKTEFEPNPKTILTWAEIQEAKEAAAAVLIPHEVLIGVATIQRELRDQGIYATPRRYHQLLDLVRASAWLDGESVAETEHLRIAQHVLWQQPDQQNAVSAVVSKVASPLDAEATQLFDELLNLRRTCEQFKEQHAANQLNDIDLKRYAMNEFGKAQQFMTTYEELEQRSQKRHRLSEPMTKCHLTLKWITSFFTEIFDIDNAQTKNLLGNRHGE